VCPTRWDDGTWELTSKDLVGGASDCGGGAIVTLETCSVVLAEGSGTVTCQPGDGGAPCTSRLTEVGDGGADGGLGGVDGSTNPSADGPSDVSP
jgi:hypothetical protein